MHLTFLNKEIRRICERDRSARQSLGVHVAGKLKDRLADLRAAASLADMPVDPPRLNPNQAGEFFLDLVEGHYLVFHSKDDDSSKEEASEINLSRIKSVKIVRIGYSHE